MSELERGLDYIVAETAFSGVVRVEREDRVDLAKAYGFAHRSYEVPNEVDTRFAIASGAKGLTALTVVSLIEDGIFELSTPARSLLGQDLPLIDDDVTIEHLLSHRSGIGDYLDEDAVLDLTDYLMPVPVHKLATTEQYVIALQGHPRKFAPGKRFAYCNGGYVRAGADRRASGRRVVPRWCPASLRAGGDGRHGVPALRRASGAYRSRLHGDRGRMEEQRLLPVRGSGDGGIYSTAADIAWSGGPSFAGRIVSLEWVGEMVRARSGALSASKPYGLGFWLHASTDIVMLEGCDAGVSFSVHDPRVEATYTVISNTTDGAWPLARYLDARLGQAAGTD